MSDIALVTGAAHGIGFEVVRQLAKQGMTVLLTARDEAKGSAAAKELLDEVASSNFGSGRLLE